MKEIKIKSFDNKELHTYIWDDVKEAKGVLQLVHGSAEHAKRYDSFAQMLNKNGYIVVGNDHRGHGKTADLEKGELGFFAEKDGWNIIIKDLFIVNEYIKKEFANLKIIMLGHSMGSFMLRTYLIQYGDTIDGAIISGTAEHGKALLKVSKWLSQSRQKLKGAKGADDFIWKLSYFPLNKKFKNEGNTGSEWQTRDVKIQKEFAEDKLCGQHFSASAFKDMFDGFLFNSNKSNLQKMRKDLPIVFVSGADDPVGNYGKAVKKSYKKFKNLGLNDVEIILYPNMRHEILFEIDKEIVEKDALAFLNKVTLK